MSGLDDVLVVTVRKSFWASPEAEAFPRRLYARVLWGHSSGRLNSLLVTLRVLVAIRLRRPRLVVLGSVERAVHWLIRARRLGLLRGARLVVTNHLDLSDAELREVERVILYSRGVIERQRRLLRERAVFFPLPADGDFQAARRVAGRGAYVFAGGGADRDFASLVDAVRDTDVTLEIVTFSPATLGYEGELPANVHVRWRMPLPAFLTRLAGALLVAVPLRDDSSPLGQTTVVQALALGKAVVTTRSPGVEEYVRDGREGLLVDAGDVDGYRRAILALVQDGELRRACEGHARARANELSYRAFRERLVALCGELLGV